HWCVGDITGTPGKSFKICIAGDKAGLWGDFADSQKHTRSLLDLWMQARNVDFKTALHDAAQWLGQPLNRHSNNGAVFPTLDDAEGRAYAQTVAGILNRLSPPAVVRIVELPDRPPKGDCVDWLECRDAQTPEDIAEELLAMVKNAAVFRELQTQNSVKRQPLTI